MSLFRHYVLAAGGTGGHMVPAHAIAQELMARGHRVALITDERGAKIPGLFEDVQTHVLPAGRMSGGISGWIRGFKAILEGRAMARQLYSTFEPAAVVGFGGYPALPAMLGAFAEGIPAIVHEQNAVLGRVNRLVARKVAAIATAYPDVKRLAKRHADKTYLVGNPVRESVLALRDEPFPVFSDESVLRLLVTGGSQGASILSQVVPAGLGMLPISLRRRLQVTQQCRPEDIEQVRALYAEMEIPADLATYIEDMPTKLAWSHLVIGRAGASTIAELTAAGRPAILIPLPSAMDNHQAYNVLEMVKAGGARAIDQSKFTPAELARQMQKLAMEPGALQNAAKRAHRCGRPDAVKDMCDLIESFGPAPQTIDTVRAAEAPRMAGLAGAGA
ncbi:UDP-N-acetylglucosamine--N-acetylmuramyl-(pentapeptide) pyrophosphoryl-undecaprenol N-acetylglucosamine transferase [Sphingobium sp. B11D3B]|uniref:undecaprenyldiphospho-muramoylpentapeptide beta-N-acetylglucosaminyltransferase n=2 Tax=Sphingobium TaxID=165695 RepID=UPI0022245C77|nr:MULTISPECIES: undecaprenyldiphospho-muramoylpentapeptide beta-N-acetylglucosaminyltransferase [unclassified Sphingobium]MCW2365470.1 UDP-N-acetylglucosamine--N-acetylmuramyl-(pentapeptide) pyrophosphoryl-undecaprenol N-acetylglucosamine transferase [Sphingobium sp. B7D2B]MCW2388893.1 UDP-N-acetylglucosamine--N-acetylmuramyl-(pentapeptide) pyrophosphoryl-undecaprenol N-acetylglucosamine transferase [Sphingobium sp. B11D3B]MCW2395428.1 UDP-N-acetylglucosamine--N-acetylmuramyl-(pentapeptide) pyr